MDGAAERYRGKSKEGEEGRSALEAASCAMDIHSRWMGIERSRSHSRTIIGRRANGSKRARQPESRQRDESL